ncbi:MAG: alpha-galactosidase [Eubacteriales bacterium]
MITFENQVFHAQTANTSYLIRVHDAGYLEHLYYGAKIRRSSCYDALFEKIAAGYGNTIVVPTDSKLTLDNLCMEYSFPATGDYRHAPFCLQMPDFGYSNDFRYASHMIYDGTYKENEQTKLPFAKDCAKTVQSGAATLDITLKDTVYPLYLHLIYTVFEQSDVITRRVKLENQCEKDINISKIMSLMLDLPYSDCNLHTFDGLWAKERHENKKALVSGLYINDSTTGSSSNRHNPFIMLSKGDCNEDSGECIGVNLIYSGNHYEAVEVSGYGKVRIMTGINPFQFTWMLHKDEAFYTPEAVLSFSKEGYNGLSRNMHSFISRHIISQYWAQRPRPILINNWEATYFDFTDAKLVKIAREAKNLGMEMLVLDDGWFGNRSDDTTSLGDWKANEKKLGGTLKKLAGKINSLGLQFGLWFEPEMISEKSDLFRKHPDWAVRAPDREAYPGRNQLVLDLTRQEVRDYIVSAVGEVLESAPIEYVKWDMNRHLSDAYSASLGQRQGEFCHRFIEGVCEVMNRITTAFPQVLFESCSSGGNRFDLGMLCYMPQIWTSDNTDANERTHIQRGTSFGYPLSSMAAHVSAVPNHQTLRSISIETRFNVACFGVLGYEIDITKLTKAEKKAVSGQISFYKAHRALFQFGTFSRLKSDDNHCIWQVVSEDKKEGIVLFYQRTGMPGAQSDVLKVSGLMPDTLYEVTTRRQFISIRQFGSLASQVSPVPITDEGVIQSVINKVYMLESEKEQYRAYGDLLMHAGIKLGQQFGGTGYNEQTRVMGDFSSRLYEIKAVDEAEDSGPV